MLPVYSSNVSSIAVLKEKETFFILLFLILPAAFSQFENICYWEPLNETKMSINSSKEI